MYRIFFCDDQDLYFSKFNGQLFGTPLFLAPDCITSGSNVILIAGVTWHGSGTTTATYNGVSMTSIRSDVSGTIKSQLFRLVNPATGAHNLVFSFSAAPNFYIEGGISFTGVDQSNPIDAQNGTTGTSSSSSVSVTTFADNVWVVDTTGAFTNGTTMSVGGSSQTLGGIQYLTVQWV